MDNKAPIAGIVLAAGLSSRFGTTKQLEVLNGRPLLDWVLDACLKSQLGQIFLVLGYKRREILQVLASKIGHPRLDIVHNPDFRKGQSTSLYAGIKALKGGFPSAMFILGDQPLIDAATLNLLIEEFRSSDKGICVPYYGSKRGNPVIFSNMYYDGISSIKGDVGARRIVDDNPDQVIRVYLKRPSFFFDVDTPEDLGQIGEFTEGEL